MRQGHEGQPDRYLSKCKTVAHFICDWELIEVLEVMFVRELSS